jgi:hypothetical protein
MTWMMLLTPQLLRSVHINAGAYSEVQCLANIGPDV